MGYKTVEVEVDYDISDFDNDDLIDELNVRRKNKKIKPDEFKELAKICAGVDPYDANYQLPSSSLEDELKVKHLISVWDKYTIGQIEMLLP